MLEVFCGPCKAFCGPREAFCGPREAMAARDVSKWEWFKCSNWDNFGPIWTKLELFSTLIMFVVMTRNRRG